MHRTGLPSVLPVSLLNAKAVVMADDDAQLSPESVLLAEYAHIKEEQRARIGFRDNLLYVTLAAVTAVVAVATQARTLQLVLALPVVCVVLGWTYLVNDEKITAIGRYIRTDLSARLQSATGMSEAAFRWEHYYRSDSRRTSRKAVQTAVDLLAFLATPFVALVGFWLYSTAGTLLVALSLLEAVGLLALGGLFLRYSER